jgi:Neuraminidase (sialidase)
VCSGDAAGGYAAFPDICRLSNGQLLCVFYSGYGHVSTPASQWRKGGRIMGVRSSDDGKSWSKPVLVMDTEQDDRDPSVSCVKEGVVLLNWFTLRQNQVAVMLARSTDHGKTWSEPANLDAETDEVPLKDGNLLAALRSSKVEMHYALSEDRGKNWGPVRSFGFKGHCPYFLRHSSGVILLAHRLPATSLHWSSDEGKTWQGPARIDSVGGAYPSMMELPTGEVYCVYYEEGKGSSIRGGRLQVDTKSVKVVANR